MSIDRRITNGLAWAGVFLVVGIPVADLVSAQLMGDASSPVPERIAMIERVAPVPMPLSQRPSAPAAEPAAQVAAAAPAAKPATQPAVSAPAAQPATQVAVAEPAKPASVTSAPAVQRAVTPAAQTADAVDAFLQSGRQMPGYITEAGATPAPTQIAAAPLAPAAVAATAPVVTPAAIDPFEVAAIPPQKTAPMPMPLSMRPQPSAVAVAPPQAIVIPPGLTPATPPVIVRPPAAVPLPAEITASDLDDWETGPLADFLAQRQAGNAYVEPDYDDDGFFLDEGPNRSRARVIARDEDAFFFID